MGKSFKLVNPRIIGTLNTDIEATDATEAANVAWNTISQHITGSVTQFTFTVEDSDNKFHSYQVSESATGKYADYTISPVEMKITKKQENAFRNELKRLKTISDKYNEKLNEKQKGGDRKKRYLDNNNDDSSDSSKDSDSDIYTKFKLFNAINKPKPIVYYWYTPLIYPTYEYYYPVNFVAPLIPYVEINLSSAFFG